MSIAWKQGILILLSSASIASVGCYQFTQAQLHDMHSQLTELKMQVSKLPAPVSQTEINHVIQQSELHFNQLLANTQQELNTLRQTISHPSAPQAVFTATRKNLLTGMIIAYLGLITAERRQDLLTAGWLLCDGSRVAKQSYPALYQVIQDSYGEANTQQFSLPDFRGVFLRGLDMGKQLDPARQLGSFQSDSNQAHTHLGEIMAAGEHTHQGVTSEAGLHHHQLHAEGYWFTSKNRNERRAITEDVDDNQKYLTSDKGEHSHLLEIESAGTHQHGLHLEPNGGTEARPKNYPVIYLIHF